MKDKDTERIDMIRFRTIIDAYGTDPSRWPNEEREAALRFVGNSTEAQEILDRAAQLDRLLDELPMMEPSLGLKRAVEAIPKNHPLQQGLEQARTQPLSSFSKSTWWKSVLAASLMIFLGVATGFATTDMQAVQEGDTEWEDFASLAFATNLDQEILP